MSKKQVLTGKIQPRMESLDKIFPILSVLWKEELEEPLGRKCVFLQPRGLGMSPDTMCQDRDMEDALLLLQSMRLKGQEFQSFAARPWGGTSLQCFQTLMGDCTPEKEKPGAWGRE